MGALEKVITLFHFFLASSCSSLLPLKILDAFRCRHRGGCSFPSYTCKELSHQANCMFDAFILIYSELSCSVVCGFVVCFKLNAWIG